MQLDNLQLKMEKKIDQKFTPLKELGEFGLINHLTKDVIIHQPNTVKGIGDDAAVLDTGTVYQVITTDLLAEGIHFNLVYTPLKHLGYKAVAVNLSDICAMNAKPKQITVALAISSKFSVEHLNELYSGIKLACQKYGVDLIGGDTTSSLTGLTICITAIGEVEKDKVTYRNGAKNTNLLCVSGNVGAAYLGLQILERERKLFEKEGITQPDFGNYTYLIERQLKPEPRTDIVKWLEEKNIVPTAMIDISDGLSSEILHICKSSNTGCRIYQEKIPLHEQTADFAEEVNMHPINAALNGGEDYELLFTVDIKHYEALLQNDQIRIIGHITEQVEGTNLVLENNEFVNLASGGWNALN